jgi:hypothetical protein
MAVRTQTAQEISRTRAGARSRRLRDNVALPSLPTVPDARVALAGEDGPHRVASWPAPVEPATDRRNRLPVPDPV